MEAGGIFPKLQSHKWNPSDNHSLPASYLDHISKRVNFTIDLKMTAATLANDLAIVASGNLTLTVTPRIPR
jgi:hypothetical protein